jgi:hypothetical protein
MAIWYSHFVVFWYIFPVLVIFIKKNLATLHDTVVIASPSKTRWLFLFKDFPPCPPGVVYVVVIVSASRTEDRGFESCQGVRFLGLNPLQSLILIVIEIISVNKCRFKTYLFTYHPTHVCIPLRGFEPMSFCSLGRGWWSLCLIAGDQRSWVCIRRLFQLPYDGQDRSRDLGGSSPMQEDGNRGKGWWEACGAHHNTWARS